jgi:hypothetical protein
MDELQWLREHSPPTQPSRETARRHRTQLRTAIASEGTDGHRPRRLRRERRSRHRVLVTTTAVVAVCALGAGIVALATAGGDDDAARVAAPGTDGTTSAAPTPACAGAPPAQLAVPAGFGNAVAAPAEAATSPPARTQAVTSWTSGSSTIEQRWPADADKVPRGIGPLADDEMVSRADAHPIVDGGIAHRTVVFSFGGQAPGCEHLQVTVYGDEKTVDRISDALIAAPFASPEPLVTTTAAATAVESAPPVIACRGPQVQPVGMDATTPVAATIGGRVDGDAFAQPADALAQFLPERKTLAQSGYRELRLPDASIVYAKDVAGNVVTTVHVEATNGGWAVTDWQASGC